MVALAVDANGAGVAVELAVELAVALGASYGAGLAVELGVELAVALGAISLGVGVIVKKKCHLLFWQSLDSVDDAVPKMRLNFHCPILCQRLESTPLLLQLCQRLDARLLNTHMTYTSTSTSPHPLHGVVQLCQRCPWAWLDQLCGCLSRQQLRQRLEPFFCCLSRQLEHLFCSCLSRHFVCGLNREIRQRLDLGCWLGRCVCHDVVRHWQSDPCFSSISGF